MNLAARLIPPSLDAKQALRLRRCGFAALGYTLGAAMVALAWMFGALPGSVVLEVTAAFVAINLGLYAAIRSGFNLRFDDPSLTRFQILAAIAVQMYIVYHMDAGRDVALFGCFFIFLFGIFRLNAREFTVVTLYTLAAYAIVINLLMHLRPQAIHSVAGEWMSWLGLAGFLPFFTVIGGKITTLRRKLRDSEVRFRSLTEISSDYFWESDTGHRLTLLSSGGRAREGPRLQQGALIGKCRWEVPYIAPDDAGWRAHRAVLSAHQPFREFEFSRLGSDGSERHVSIGGDPVFDTSGAFKGYRGVGTDISARRQAEIAREHLVSQLRESQKMEALGTLAGGVAHDFNNALAAILGNLELARQDVGPGHQALVSLEEIGKASRRAKDLVQQILAFGRRQKLERKVMSLALVAVESARLLRATLPAQVSLRVDCEGDTPAVLADATQVKQILLNLCSNALQAVQDQERPGAIEIRLHAHTQAEAGGERRAGRYACLMVRDNGAGMDEATRSRIYEPFFTTKPKGKGTGLGLSVVHGIVQAHDASIEVESTPGKGSEFRIYFPAAEAPVADAAAPAPDALAAPGEGKHVLYVDDEEAIIFLMTRLLERQGYRVSGYTDPQAALAAARANPDDFDLAVTDYNMPGLSGLDVAQALKEIRADLPVVLASGYITEELRAHAPAAGVRELIYKPDTVEDLCAAVARLAQTVGRIPKSS